MDEEAHGEENHNADPDASDLIQTAFMPIHQSLTEDILLFIGGAYIS